MGELKVHMQHQEKLYLGNQVMQELEMLGWVMMFTPPCKPKWNATIQDVDGSLFNGCKEQKIGKQ